METYLKWLTNRTNAGLPYAGAEEYSKETGANITELLSMPNPHANDPVYDPVTFLPIAGTSRGLGDTIAKITHTTGIGKLAELYTKVTGKDCGCKGRQEFLNKLLPYGIKEEDG